MESDRQLWKLRVTNLLTNNYMDPVPPSFKPGGQEKSNGVKDDSPFSHLTRFNSGAYFSSASQGV